MAIYTTVNGDISFSTGNTPTSAVVEFALTRWDTATGITFIPGTHDAKANVNPANGQFSISLWATDEGDRNATYLVRVREFYSGDDFTGSRQETHILGPITVPVAGPVNLADLLNSFTPPPEATLEDFLLELQAAVASAEAAAVEAEAARDVTVATAQYTYPDLPTLLAETANIAVGSVVMTRAEGYSYIVAPLAATDHHLTGSNGQKFYVHPGNGHVEPAMFGAYGIKALGAMNIEDEPETLDWQLIPDETAQLQAMFDFAIRYGKPVHMGAADRDYGISETLVMRPTADTVQGAVPISIQHMANQNSFTWHNDGNTRIVALAPMDSMILLRSNPPTVGSPPCWSHWSKVRLHGNGMAENGIRTRWSYRNKYDSVRVLGCVNGWWMEYDAGSEWTGCEVRCSFAAAVFANAGDWSWEGGDIWVVENGLVLGGGNNGRIRGVTYTRVDNGDTATVRKCVKLYHPTPEFPASFVRSRSIRVTESENAGCDWLLYGDDDNLDGELDLFSIYMAGNHVIHGSSSSTSAGLIYLRNAHDVTLVGNSHGALIHIQQQTPSIHLVNVMQGSINDNLTKCNNAILLENCNGIRISSSFLDCGIFGTGPIVQMTGCFGCLVSGSTCRWQFGVNPTTSLFVAASGGGQNIAINNTVDINKMVRPYSYPPALNYRFEHHYSGLTNYAGGTIAPNTGVNVPVVIPGARVGDECRASISVGQQDIDIKARINIDGAVQVTLYNSLGTNITLPACTVYATAMSR